MKTVEMKQQFDYPTHEKRFVRFYEGVVYSKVLEAAATAIVDAGAGRILTEVPYDAVDASHAWRFH